MIKKIKEGGNPFFLKLLGSNPLDGSQTLVLYCSNQGPPNIKRGQSHSLVSVVIIPLKLRLYALPHFPNTLANKRPRNLDENRGKNQGKRSYNSKFVYQGEGLEKNNVVQALSKILILAGLERDT